MTRFCGGIHIVQNWWTRREMLHLMFLGLLLITSISNGTCEAVHDGVDPDPSAKSAHRKEALEHLNTEDVQYFLNTSLQDVFSEALADVEDMIADLAGEEHDDDDAKSDQAEAGSEADTNERKQQFAEDLAQSIEKAFSSPIVATNTPELVEKTLEMLNSLHPPMAESLEDRLNEWLEQLDGSELDDQSLSSGIRQMPELAPGEVEYEMAQDLLYGPLGEYPGDWGDDGFVEEESGPMAGGMTGGITEDGDGALDQGGGESNSVSVSIDVGDDSYFSDGIPDHYSPSTEQREEAFDLLRASAEMGYKPALLDLGRAYMFGGRLGPAPLEDEGDFKVDANITRATELLFEVIEEPLPGQKREKNPNNDGDSGKNAKKSSPRNSKFKKERGQAHTIIGFLFSSGASSLVPKHEMKAVEHYNKGGQLNDFQALLALGHRRNAGKIMKRSCKAAALHYFKAAEYAVTEMADAAGAKGAMQLRLADGIIEEMSESSGAEFLDFYEQAASSGDLDSQLAVAEMYYFGDVGIPQNVNRAAYYFRQAADQGHADALYNLALLKIRGIGVEKDNQTALEMFEEAAAMGSPAAQNGLGSMYLNGEGVERNETKAFELLKAASDQQHPEAMANLAVLYMHGFGTKRNMSEAIRLLEDATAVGDVHATFNLGAVNFDRQNCSFAVKQLKAVAETSDPPQLFTAAYDDYVVGALGASFLKYLFLSELGYDAAFENAAYLIENHPEESLIALNPDLRDSGIAYLPSPDDVEEVATDGDGESSSGGGDSQAIEQQANARKSKRKLTEVGELQEQIMVPLYRESAAQNNSLAVVKLGDMFYYGQYGLEQNLTKALEFYSLGHELGDPAATFNYGYMAEHGEGMDQNRTLALECYWKSASDFILDVETWDPAIIGPILAYAKLAFEVVLSGEGSLSEVFPGGNDEEVERSEDEVEEEREAQEEKKNKDFESILLAVLCALMGVLVTLRFAGR